MHNRFDTRSLAILRHSALAALLLAPAPVSAKNVTMNDITVDVPSDFQATDYERGMEVKTEDEEVFLWFETCKGSEVQDLLDEHNKYWKENDVVLNDPVDEKTTQANGTKQQTLDFKNATWKGKPTVLRYVIIGPLGSANSRVVYTLWASPEGSIAHAKEIQSMLASMDAKVAK